MCDIYAFKTVHTIVFKRPNCSLVAMFWQRRIRCRKNGCCQVHHGVHFARLWWRSYCSGSTQFFLTFHAVTYHPYSLASVNRRRMLTTRRQMTFVKMTTAQIGNIAQAL